MKKFTFKIFGLLCFVIFSAALLTQKSLAINFDPNGNIATETNLPTGSPVDITIKVIQWVLGFLGLVAIVLVIYGGFTWMTAGGNEERIKKAKEILKTSLIGLLIITLSWAIVAFVFARIKLVAE